MHRPSLESLPPLAPAAGCDVRSYRPGDERAWVAIINDSFGFQEPPDYFHRRLGDEHFRPERVWFAVAGGQPAATASAWASAKWGDTIGVLHMVGALAAHRGRGLGHLVCLAALHQMRREGRTAAVLSTDDFRLAAVRTYLRLGFEPYLVHENQRDRWRLVLPAAGAEAGRFAAVLAGPLHAPAT